MKTSSLHSIPPPGQRTFIQWARRYVSPTFLAVVAVLTYILFFSDNSATDSYVYDREIDRLKEQLRIATDSANYYRDLNRRLKTDPEATEQVVREHYHMQRPNEDVYITISPQ